MRKAAGLLVYQRNESNLLVFLVHPGGPFWKAKDKGAWSIPKGEIGDEEDALAAARREFTEETGQPIEGSFIPLSSIRQKSGKVVFAWAVDAEVDADNITSNTIEIEYPYRSGKMITIPEVDKGGWFSPEEARQKINPAQLPLLDELWQKLQSP